jgi:ferredoxin
MPWIVTSRATGKRWGNSIHSDMCVKSHRITFPGTGFAPVNLPDLACLPLHLTVQNSPVLFGCRSGLCGTCLIEAEADNGELEPPDDAEAETLGIYAPGNVKARLACQLILSTDLRIRKIESA